MKSNNCNALSPARQGLTRLPRPPGQGDSLVDPVSVARVRPRTSKGITASGSDRRAQGQPAVPPTFDLPGLTIGGLVPPRDQHVPQATTSVAHPFPRVATALSPGLATGSAKPSPAKRGAPAFPVPGGVAYARGRGPPDPAGSGAHGIRLAGLFLEAPL